MRADDGPDGPGISERAAPYRRRATPMERLFTRSPFSIVSVVVRIRGDVTEEALRAAVAKVRLRHPNMRARVVDDEHHNPWLVSEGAAAIPIEVIERESADQWAAVVREVGKVPFDFEERPPVRLVLVRSAQVSELVIMCHHILCDGMSLAYLARDVLDYLGDPSQSVTALPDPDPVTLETMPQGVSLNRLVRFMIQRINSKWAKDPAFFDQQDYEALADAYWQHYEHLLRSIEFSEEETDQLVDRCRRERVTVNTALATAFSKAQVDVLGDRHDPEIAVAGDLRDRLRQPAGEVMGFYASAITISYRYDPKIGFWANARKLHADLQASYTDKAFFNEPLTWSHLDPTILEAINFKKLGALVPGDGTRGPRLRDFSMRKDVVSRILERDKLESPDRVFLGTALTNLTRLDFPSTYGSLQLERLIMKPGGAFPLANVNLVVGAATAAGRLSLTLEYVEQNISEQQIETIKSETLALLAGSGL